MKIANYRDGGTRSFKDSKFDVYFKLTDIEICQDNRIGSPTKGTWWLDHPDRGRLLTKEEEKYCVEEIVAYLGREYDYAKYIYEDIKNSNLNCHFKDNFQKEFGLKSSSYVGGNSTSIYKNTDGYNIIDENGECSLKGEESVIFSGSLEECFNYYFAKKDEKRTDK